MTSLPFPGYSWYFTQHAIGFQPKTLYGLLACAALAQGKTKPGEIINQMIVENGLLTNNIRNGEVDAWRDYQQILAEAGLIYSTLVHRKLKLTTVGEMFLASDIGFSELMTIQALRYQYPNGQKATIQSRLKQELESNHISVPSNLIELMSAKGVLIKPGLLILRLLLEMKNKTGVAYITVDECGNHLVPLKRNSDWELAYSELMNDRKNDAVKSLRNKNVRRNVQDWFKFLDKTDLFYITANGLALSPHAFNLTRYLQSICEDGGKEERFWFPKTFDPIDKESWFSFFGEIPFDMQLMMPLNEITEEYKQINYVSGFEEEFETQFYGYDSHAPTVNLSSISNKPESGQPSTIKSEEYPFNQADIEQAWQNFQQGNVKRKAKTLLHDSIVKELAVFFKDKGAQVYEDRDSVDLLVKFESKPEALFEIKTVNRRSLQQRLRLAVGQLEEYSYRRKREAGELPEKVIVINTEIPKSSWQIDFLNNYLSIGLLCKKKAEYRSHVPSTFHTAEILGNIII